jgi:hypothetical protein
MSICQRNATKKPSFGAVSNVTEGELASTESNLKALSASH